MILPVALLITTLVVALAGRRLSGLARLPLRGIGWILLATVLQMLITTVAVGPTTGRTLHLASYAAAAVFVVVNRAIPGLPLTASGGAMNLAAIAANGGVMPASETALRTAGLEHAAGRFVNSSAVDGARLSWLGDVLAVPARLPLANVFSIGDVVLVAGFAVLLVRACPTRSQAAEAPVAGTGDDLVGHLPLLPPSERP